MLKNYFTVAVRNLQRQKGYTFINIIGLTLGIACCLLIYRYVAFEYSFDTFNKNATTLYRVYQASVHNGEQPQKNPLSGYAMGPALAQEVPEVVRFARIHPDYANPIISNPTQPDKSFEETKVYYADPAFLQMFSYPLLKGDPGTALSESGTVLISQSAAQRYFGSEDPIGKTLDVTGWIKGVFRVNGILKDVPANSHLQFDILLPMADLLEKSDYKNKDIKTGWGWHNFITYVQLRKNADPAEVERKFTSVLMKYEGDHFRQVHMVAHLGVQRLLDIHLNDTMLVAPSAVMSSYRTVYFFSFTGLIVFLIALVNYINLATARALNRAREVGIRKVVGANRWQLVTQFLCESALASLIAIGLASALTELLWPVENNLAETNLTHMTWDNLGFGFALLAAFCLSTLLGGLYPAFVLSSFRPATVLKGKFGVFAAQGWLRRGLVVFQFAASIALLAGTGIVDTQIDFMRHMNLGIHLEQILTIPTPRVLPQDTNKKRAVDALTRELHQLPDVQQIATSGSIPGRGFNFYTSDIRKATADPSTAVSGAGTFIDTSFASLYGLKLIAGEGFRNLPYPLPKGAPSPIILNETTVQALGFDTPADALDQEAIIGGDRARIVGVFKDFNWSSAHEARMNTVFYFSPNGGRRISIKVSTNNLPRTLAAIERTYKQLFPGNPFKYAFVDELFDQQYRNDQRFANLFSFFAGLTLVIACLGLFGLASFSAQQRTKEIGVRKVLGASATNIVTLLTKDFLKLVAIAFLIGTPIAYFSMQHWLTNFAYRIHLGPGVFLLSGVLALTIAFLTVSAQSFKAALTNPVDSLKDE